MIGISVPSRFREQFPPNPVPRWLDAVNEDSHFDRNHVLANSVFYPGSWLDGSPIDAYGGFAHSFVYVDYAVKKDEALEGMQEVPGYKPIFFKDVSQYELSPTERHHVTPTVADCAFTPRPVGGADTAELRIAAYIQQNARIDAPYCIWGVYQREVSTDSPGWRYSYLARAERISLLFVGGEGVATYQALYNSNGIVPVAIVLCAADARGFGGNWTDFEKRGGILERVVMANPAGIPQYLFTGNNYEGGKRG